MLYAGAVVYAFLVFLGTAVLGFVVAPFAGHAIGLFPIETDAQAAFSLLTLKAVPFLAGASTAAALSYEWVLGFSLPRRFAVYGATVIVAWVTGAAIAAVILG
jgi:hypothetical protein